MTSIKKAYGYVTRIIEGRPQVLVLQHPVAEAGIQIPKGTVQPGEETQNAVLREMEEETGLRNLRVEQLLAEDLWENDDGSIHHRFFYELPVFHVDDEWDHDPTGGGEEEGLTFHFFWISSIDEVELIRGHGDYLPLIFN
ncbi:NUDIX hydrolase [Halobacillus trueperi]|uniref:NUDIX domain-containing protein n=1 Tax=Halobacillus trueperi TaxID=156205 RepID=A0A3E0JE85_9BACI|nr:NUDIX domain-containing protein [Halobacillus trueperi]REJ11089.1 NUDIX domain-containing protein [Halobacillus trueperi]